MKKTAVRIGTRGSKLALWQANYVKSLLDQKGIKSRITVIKTQGDLIQNIGFDKLEGKGFFTKEIEDALLQSEIDIAIHSMKDLPTDHPKGLVIGGISKRANPQDYLIIKQSSYRSDAILKIPKGAVIGTSSIRRKVLLKSFQNDINFKDIRGNVPTRIKKLDEDIELDAIILAAAGIERLEIDLTNYHVIKLNPQEFPCAPAQGVMAYQCREDDIIHRRILKSIHSDETVSSVNVERKVLKLMDGGCQLPLGVYCYRDQAGNYHCYAAFRQNDSKNVKFANLSQSTVSELAERIVEKLRAEK